MSSSGLKLAVRYALPPFSMGFCGPQEENNLRLLADFAKGQKLPQSEVRRILERFEAMYPYLCLIAEANGIVDPFDVGVVKSYWVGGRLLDSVKGEDLRRLIRTGFVGSRLFSEEEAERRATLVREGMVPHHSFHVLVLGSVTGRVNFTNTLREPCRINWGKVMGVKSKRAEGQSVRGELKVRCKPLIFGEDGRMRLGEEVEKSLEWEEEIVPGVGRGDWVSFHWGRVCDILNEEDVANLEKYTKKTLDCLTAGS